MRDEQIERLRMKLHFPLIASLGCCCDFKVYVNHA